MKLIDLSPRWIAHDGNPRAALIFKCPHCDGTWLTCTFQPIKMSTQMELYRPEGEASGGQVVPAEHALDEMRKGNV